MNQPNALHLPENAFEVASEKGTDFYADLTDDERAAEGLPPREAAKAEADPPPEDKAPVGDPPPDEVEEEEEEEEEAGDDASAQEILDQIAGLRQDLAAEKGEKEPKSEAKRDQWLEDALEDENPTVRAMAERIRDQQVRLDAVEAAARHDAEKRQLAQDDADRAALKENFTIGGKPMSNNQIQMVDEYMASNKEVARLLSFEEATRRVFPAAKRVEKSETPPAGKTVRTPAPSRGEGSTTATIVDGGSSGGAPAGPWKPGPGETVDSAIAAACKQFGWGR